MRNAKQVLVLSSSEYRLMLYGLIHFRNKLTRRQVQETYRRVFLLL